MGVDTKDRSSKYATFETKNGKIVTIRISDHNATVSNFDNNREQNGISIVVSRRPNKGVTNDGYAHVVEFFYSDKKLKTADGKPLVEILKSIKQALYSGEYKDTTGLAVREEVNMDALSRQGEGARQSTERERQKMSSRVQELAEKLHLDNVEVVTDSNRLEGKKQRAKGFYSKSTGKITIVIPNHSSAFDVEQTLLHEAVAHYGLRRLFGEHFDTFLDNVFNNADKEVRRRIVELATENGWNFRKATEEYLASLAENTNFENTNANWWQKIKSFFLDMLHKIGFEDFRGVTLTDNELRYILWRSYENLAEPGRYRSILGEAADIAKQYKLGVGNYAEGSVGAARVAQVNEEEYSEEEQQIIERAKSDGTYMKAPNGQPTNLSPKQWAQVRTKAFKKWFGDWELATTETPIHRSKGSFENLAEAEKWAKENLQGQSRVNKYTGEEISISRKSVNEMLNEKTLKQSHSIGSHLAALQSVLDFIETGIPAEVHTDTHGRDFDVMRLYNAIEIDGKVYRVKSTVRKVKQGDKFYTYEVQEMELIEERGANPNREGESPHNGNTSNNSITGAKLLNGVKKTNSNEDILQYSKVVDENGEPKILEHSTWNDDFYTFDIEKLGESSGDEGVYGAGFYFGNVGETSIYGDRKIHAYLNMRKPLILPDYNIMGFFGYLVDNFNKSGLRDIVVKGNGKTVTMGEIIDAIEIVIAEHRNGKYNELIENMKLYWTPESAEDRVLEQKIFREVGFAFYRSLNTFIENNIGRREFSKMLSSVGYDGVIFNNKEWVAFSPNQIKSATDNVGTFSQEEDDIRYREGDTLRERYDRAVRTPNESGSVKWHENFVQRAKEGYVDNMTALKTLQDLIAEHTGNEIKSYENAYDFENRMSSMNKGQTEIFERDFYKPLMEAVGELVKQGAAYEDIKKYLIAKHGLERNRVFSKRDVKGNRNVMKQLVNSCNKYRNKICFIPNHTLSLHKF